MLDIVRNIGAGLSRSTERWVPDSWVICMFLTSVALFLAVFGADVSAVTALLAYAYGDSTTNLIQPFFAIPILAVTRLRFGDIVGYTFIVALACFVVTLFAMGLISPHL